MSKTSKEYVNMLGGDERIEYLRMRNSHPELGDTLVDNHGVVYANINNLPLPSVIDIPVARRTTWKMPGTLAWRVIDLFDLVQTSYNNVNDTAEWRIRRYGE